MEFALVLVAVGLLVFFAHLFVVLFERTKIPEVLYLILIGVVIGPVLQIVSPADFGKVGHVFTTIALVVILFEGGLELGIEHLRSAWRKTLVLTLASYAAAFVCVAAAAIWLMDVSTPLALFVGAVLAAPAPAVVIPLARQYPFTSPAKAVLMLEAPLGEAIGIVVALGILDSMRYESVQIGHLLGRLLASFAFALLIGGAGGFAWSILLNRIRQLRHAIFTTPAFLLVLFGVTELLGFSGPVTALTFGLTLANAGTREFPWLQRKYNLTPLQHDETEKAFFGEIVFLIKTFFFVYLGLSATFVDLWTLVLALVLTAALLLARVLSVRLASGKNVTVRKDALLMGMMVPKGTAAAVLGAIPVQMALAGGGYVQNVVYTAIVVSIVITAILLFLVEKTAFADVVGLAFRGYGETVMTHPKHHHPGNDGHDRSANA